MQIDKEKFIQDIRHDLGIRQRQESGDTTPVVSTQETTSTEDLGEIVKSFLKLCSGDEDLNNPDNVYAKCKISKKDAIRGCEKRVSIKRTLEDNTQEKAKIDVEIPKNIKTGQKIIIAEEGNRTPNNVGHLVVDILVK